MTERLVDLIVALDQALDAADVPHAFGGALALAYAVESPRGTVDIDVNLFVGPDHAHRVFDALPDGVAWKEQDLVHVVRDGQVRIFWGRTPLDLFFNTAPFHEHVHRNIRRVPFEQGTIPVLGPDELAVFKCFFDRRKDWADLEAMVDAGFVRPDVVEHWLISLLGADDDRLRRFRELVGERNA